MAQMLEYALKMSMLFHGQASAQFTKTAESISQLQKKTQELTKTAGKIESFQKQQTTLNATREKLESARERVRRLREEYRKSDNPSDAMRKQLANAQKEAGQLGEKFSEQRKKLAELNSELKRSGVDTSKLAEYQQKLAQSVDKSKAAQDRLAQAQSRYQKIRGQFTWDNMRGDVLSSMGLLKTLQKPVTVSMNYEQAMSQVKAVANPNAEEYAKLRAQSLELGRTTQFSAIQAANSQENLARAGFTVDKILNMMPEVLNVAASDGMDLAQAADIVGGSLRGFNLASTEAKRIADILAYTSSHSATNVTMAGAALQGVSGTALLQGISPEIAASYIGILANRANLQGTEAATTLERSISALALRKGDAEKALSAYGIATRTKSGGMVRLEEIVTQLYEKTQSAGTMAQQKAFMQVFGKAYGGDMLKFSAGVRSGELAELQAGLKTQKDNSARIMAGVRNDNLMGDLTSLSSAYEGFMEAVGNPLQEWSRGIVQGVTELLNKITSLVKEFPLISEYVMKIGAGFALWKVGATVFKYTRLLFQLPGALMELRMAQHAAETLTMANNLSSAGKSAGFFGMSLSSALGTLSMIALVSYEIWQNWEHITEWAQKAGDAITSLDTGKISSAKAGTLQRNDTNYGIAVMSSTYQPPSIAPHAEGGIFSRPHVGLVAEAGAEAIIPLSNKSRGLPILNQAMNILGVRSDENDTGRYILRNDYSVNNNRGTSQYISPVVNLTVNFDGANNDGSITERIRAAVVDAMNEIFSREERLAYA